MKNRLRKYRVWDTLLKMWVNNIGMQKNNVLTTGEEKRFIVMDYVGKIGIKENEVWEGDVWRSKNGVLYQIVWEDSGFIAKGINSHFEMRISKLVLFGYYIGNIFDNPELIK